MRISHDILWAKVDCDSEEREFLTDYLSFEEARFVRGKRVQPKRHCLFSILNHSMPAGLVPTVVKAATEAGFAVQITDARTRPFPLAVQPDLAWLRDYQRTALDRMVASTRGILWMPTGAGKTEVAVGLYRALPGRWLFLTHRKGLMGQAADRFEARTGVEAGRVGESRWHAEPDFTCATFQTVARALTKNDPRAVALLDSAQGIIVDECFPAGTLVGGVPIDSLREGDLVPSYDEATGAFVHRRVVRRFLRKPSAMVRVVFGDGTSVTCTPNHQFLTEAGWLPAESLCGQAVLSASAAGTGPTQAGVPRTCRVASVEVLQRGGDGTFGGVCPDGLVYNVEVEGTHAYLVDGRVVHNCHCLPADSFWRVVMQAKRAYYRVGLSGTPLARGDRRSVLAIAALGPVVYRLRPDVLIEAGVLAKPRIVLLKVEQESSKPTWQGVYGECIVRSRTRNEAVVEAVKAATKPCLLFVKEVAHGRELEKRLGRAGLKSAFVWGRHSDEWRRTAIDQLVRGAIDVLVTSVIMQEGTDIPSLESVVVASGGKSAIAALQRIGRGMRSDGGRKATFEVFDFEDVGHRWLERHTKERLRAYRSEGFETTSL